MTLDPGQHNKDLDNRARDCAIITAGAAVLFLSSVLLEMSKSTELRTLSMLLFIASIVCGAWAFSKIKPLHLLSNLFNNLGLVAMPTRERVGHHIAAIVAAVAIHAAICFHRIGHLPSDQAVFRTLIVMALLFAPFIYLESIAGPHPDERPRTPILLLHRQTCILLIILLHALNLLNSIPVRGTSNQMLMGWPYSDSYAYDLLSYYDVSHQQREYHFHLQSLNFATALAIVVATIVLSEFILRRKPPPP